MDRYTDTVKTMPPKSHKQSHTYMILIHILTPNIFFSQIYTRYLFSFINVTANIFLFIILPAPPPHPPQKEKSQSMQVKVPLLAEGSETLFYQVKHMKQVD